MPATAGGLPPAISGQQDFEMLQSGKMSDIDLKLPIPQSFNRIFRIPNIIHCLYKLSKGSESASKVQIQIMERDGVQFPVVHLPIIPFSTNNNSTISSETICNKSKITYEEWKYFLESYRKNHGKRANQHLYAIVFIEGIGKEFYVERPDRSSDITEHTETKVIRDIGAFLENQDKARINIFLYTYNSPCMKRENKDIDPCMFQLIKSANQWQNEFNAFTYIFFSKFWGPVVPSHLSNDINQMRRPEMSFSLSKKEIEKQLKNFHKNIKELLGMLENNEREILFKDFKKAKCNLLKLTNLEKQTKEEYLARGKEIILSTFNPKVQEKIHPSLYDVWINCVDKCAADHLRAELTRACNDATVKCFLKLVKTIFNTDRFIDFYHLPNFPDLD